MSQEKLIALVTGASKGIGHAIAVALSSAGYHVVGAARGEIAPLAGMEPQRCDVADADQVQALFDGIRQRHGVLHLLVNNAGIAGGAAFASAREAAEWDGILATNLTGTYLCCRAAADLLPDHAGRIVNIASVLGLRGVPDQVAYTAAKHGVVGLTRALAQALGPRGITVNAICPGWVDTTMAQARYADLGITAADAAAMAPTGRVTQPEEVAAMVLYLASAAAANVTGQALVIDGGASG
ncbi:SDR family oxidoreductase [Ferrovibrio sp.]|uniref:SDR family NAD(P)-dependent oxidoreductase n=1 Tax=Ferrovibrio sp. TaxID=1917215 RepID=UPI001B6B74DF|nr:SDR family oxidoreductase [Ferrovibrio sp.]MBP7065447.1 SDR family oxidoreductase [Ferrovibrio sp.]